MVEKNDRNGGNCVVLFLILMNTIISVLLIAGFVYCITQLAQQQNNIATYQQLLSEFSEEKNGVPKEQGLQSLGENDEDLHYKVKSPETPKTKKERNGENEDEEEVKVDDSEDNLLLPNNCCGEDASTAGRRHTQSTSKYQSAQVVGNGGRMNFKEKSIVTAWKESQVAVHNMKYAHGQIQVGVSGYYYIYSQLYDNDITCKSQESLCEERGHRMYIDSKLVLKAIRSFERFSANQQTMYIGGIFKIRKGQKIYVKVTHQKYHYFNETLAYFGAFMISR